MRLAKIIDELNQFEKGAFVKLLEQLAEANGKGAMLNDILIKSSGDELRLFLSLKPRPFFKMVLVSGKRKCISNELTDPHDPRKKPSAPFMIDLSIARLRLASERVRRMAGMEFSVY